MILVLYGDSRDKQAVLNRLISSYGFKQFPNTVPSNDPANDYVTTQEFIFGKSIFIKNSLDQQITSYYDYFLNNYNSDINELYKQIQEMLIKFIEELGYASNSLRRGLNRVDGELL